MENFEQLLATQRIDQVEGQKDSWPEITVLPELPKAPALDLDLAKKILPSPLLDWVADYSWRAQVPLESAAVCAIGSLASLIGRKLWVFPKANDTFGTPSVLWTAIVARPGEKKSSIINFALSPLVKIEEKLIQSYIVEHQKYQNDLGFFELEQEKFKNEFKKGFPKTGKGNSLFTEDQLRLKHKAEFDEMKKNAPQKPIEKRLRVSDPTVASLGPLLANNPNGIIVVRDELVGWINSFNKPGSETDRAFFLEGWDASGKPFYIDRISREPLKLPGLAIHIMGGIQPGKLEQFVKQAIKSGGGDDGFLQRFQLMVYPELKKAKWIDQPPKAGVEQKVTELFEWIHNLEASSFVQVGEKSGLRFDWRAYELYKAWHQDLEEKKEIEADLNPAFCSHISKYPRLITTLALVIELVESFQTNNKPSEISGESLQRSAMFVDLLEGHARKIYAMVGDYDLSIAQALLKRILKSDIPDGMSIREVVRKNWGRIGEDTEQVRSGFLVLERHGYLRVCHKQNPGGSRQSDVIHLNPALGPNGKGLMEL